MTIPEPADWDIEDPETGNKLRVAWMAGDHAAFILTGSEGFPLTPGQCREAAARLVAHADRMDPNTVADWLTEQHAAPHIHWAPHGGQWTRDDLMPRREIVALSYEMRDRGLSSHTFGDAVLGAFVDHLNAHHPKPVPYDQGGWPKPGPQVTANVTETDAALRAELMGAYGARDRLSVLLDEAKEERDAAVARAEKAERERDEADRRTAAAEEGRDRWKLHHDRVDGQWAKAEREVTRLRDTGAVTKADIEKAIRSCVVMHRWLDNAELVEVPYAIDAVCKELGVGAEQAVDPVEAKARELATLAYPEDGFVGAFDVADDDAKAAYRRIARHLVWQETGQ